MIVMLPEKFLARKRDCKEALAKYNHRFPKTEVFSLNEIRKKRRRVNNPMLCSVSMMNSGSEKFGAANKRIVILGSSTLKKYTDFILVKGFRELDWTVTEKLDESEGIRCLERTFFSLFISCMQMYHFGERIRTCESSGSLHATKGI
jgi:hypothetical protein